MNGDVPIGQLFSQLVDDGKRYARAEVELYKAKAADKAQPVKRAAIYGGIALTLALSAVTALLVGLILALQTLVGPLAATLIVVLVTLILAGGLGYLAYKQVLEARR
ncbi:phage holin family protein [Sphingomonas sp. MAH-20]|uniref:Phage holin family protein n=1 Tax=Sphingomonas horti TaxID=2682842 RepID=A0A6I4IW99_9SPHN|nr:MULTISPECIES: phage holin family protein [Sphingomonas]MBA2920094.1 phage holin family protein [Sphingomonas sp. CGMCC 1.13658]MVO76349.1 phage holin family protein [Sphingomonas horti]